MRKNDNLTSPPRERVSVAIQGLDRSTPDDLCKDGTCEELHNLRYKDSAWRPVSNFTSTSFIAPLSGTDKVVYKHPASAEDKYILQRIMGDYYYYYELSTTHKDVFDAPLIATFAEEQRVSHFGNVLMFVGDDKTTYYTYRKGVYSIFTFESLYPSITSDIHTDPNSHLKPLAFSVSENFTISFNTPNSQNFNYAFKTGYWYEARSSIHADFNVIDEVLKKAPASCKFRFMWEFARWDNVDSTKDEAEYTALPSSQDNRWNGEHAMFAALRMKDGTIINPSPISIGISQNKFSGCEIRKEEIKYCVFRNTHYEANFFHGIVFCTREYSVAESPTYNNLPDAPFNFVYEDIVATIPTSVDHNLIDSLAIYSTRIYPSIDIAKIRAIKETSILLPIDVYNETLLASQPFYLIAEKKLKECDTSQQGLYSLSIRLYADDAERIVTNAVYTPLIHNSLIGTGDFDYNNRLHIFNTEQRLPDYPSINAIKDEAFSFTAQMGVHVQNSDIDAVKWGAPVNGLNAKSEFAKILSFPDYRAEEFLVHVATAEPYTIALPTKEAMGNNIAYYTATPNNEEKYPDILFLESAGHSSVLVPTDDDVIYEPNRLQVSSANNPFSFPFENSYSVGSANNRIIALQSAAIKIGDEKVGALPLYAFTSEGIYALRAGDTALYAAVNPINYDKIINPNTLAINGAIVYITEKGVHLLTDAGTQVISSPIHDKDGRPPLDFLRTCQLIWPKEHNEVIFHNESVARARGFAYVFNLDSGYWSTRDLSGYKLNTDEMVDGKVIYNLNDEDETSTLPCHITTRPMKFGNVEMKRVETMIPRMTTGNKALGVIQLYGAIMPNEYKVLRSVNAPWNTPLIIRRTPFSAKYFKAALSLARSSPSFSITHIDFEWYRKFQHRMR